MPFMHKLSRRLALLKDLAWVIPACAFLSCELPVQPSDNPLGPSRLVLSPQSKMIRVNQTTSVAAQAQTTTGSAVVIAVTFRVHGTAGGQILTTVDSASWKLCRYQSFATSGVDTVFATLASGIADTAVIQVTPMPVTAMTLTPATATVSLGGTAPFSANLRDSLGNTLAGRAVTWRSTATSVATVDASGVATGISIGTSSIIATSEGVSDTSTVTVSGVPVASVTLAPASATVAVGATQSFTATMRDGSGNVLSGRVVTWTSSNTAVATVTTSGVARGVTAGSASIIATSEGKADTSLVTVIVVPVSSISVTPASARIAVGATASFTATTRDSAGGTLTGRVITWSSTNTGVATVTGSGVATGVTAGSASIIATSEGKADTSALTVVVVPVASVTVTPASKAITVGATTSFTATTRDSAGGTLTGRSITWNSTNTSVATVNGSGVASGLVAGSALIIATSEGKADTATLTVSAAPPPGAVPDPTLLPVANRQAPNATAYNALNVPSQAAGWSYNDPVTGVKIWKVTSGSVPAANGSAGHDYSDGGNEVSLGWGTNSNTHTILIAAGSYYLVDFTRGVGFTNYRRLPAAAQPDRDLCATFSNVEPQILFVISGNVLKRFNTQTMLVETAGNFPRSIPNHYAWLHQDRNDAWFVGVQNGNSTGWAFNAQTGQFLTHNEAWSDELRIERDGRYAVFSDGGGQVRIWDLSNNTFGPSQNQGANFWFAHLASLRSVFITEDANANFPFAEDRYYVSGGQLVKTAIWSNSLGNLGHHSGNWVQSDAELGGNLNRQWAYLSGYGADNAQFTWREAVGLLRADGSDQRLLLHHYSMNPAYFAIPWGKPSPDGKVVVFNSNMNGSGRYDLFVAEVPLR